MRGPSDRRTMRRVGKRQRPFLLRETALRADRRRRAFRLRPGLATAPRAGLRPAPPRRRTRETVRLEAGERAPEILFGQHLGDRQDAALLRRLDGVGAHAGAVDAAWSACAASAPASGRRRPSRPPSERRSRAGRASTVRTDRGDRPARVCARTCASGRRSAAFRPVPSRRARHSPSRPLKTRTAASGFSRSTLRR